MKPALLLAALLVLVAVPCGAQLRAASMVTDNDAYDFWIPFDVRPDREYTNGLELRAELGGAPLWGRLARGACEGADTACLATELRVGQKIFTPSLDATVLQPGQRPYAGWLYLAAAGSVRRERFRRTGEVEVGVTGPPSQGEWVQTTFHRVAGFRAPLGWGGQLRTEPGIVVRYGEEWLAADVRPAGLRVAELVPYWGAALGNVRTGAHGGARLRAGYAVPHPWSSSARRAPFSAYLLAGARGEAVARDLFLDGNTFGDTPSVRRTLFLAQAEAGAGVQIGPLGVLYRVVSRTRSYSTERKGHAYGSFEVTLRTNR